MSRWHLLSIKSQIKIDGLLSSRRLTAYVKVLVNIDISQIYIWGTVNLYWQPFRFEKNMHDNENKSKKVIYTYKLLNNIFWENMITTIQQWRHNFDSKGKNNSEAPIRGENPLKIWILFFCAVWSPYTLL